jgi:hypothetical protein
VVIVDQAPALPFRVAHDLDWSSTSELRIVHVGQSGILLVDAADGTDHVVPVTWGGRGLVPGGIELAAPDAARVSASLRLFGPHDLLDLSAWRAAAAARGQVVDLRMPPVPLRREGVQRLRELLAADPAVAVPDASMDPGHQRCVAPALAGAVLDDDPTGIRELVDRLIGSGPGATPSGDDVVVGALAGLEAATRCGLLDAQALRGRRRLRADAVAASRRTTTPSRHDLVAAADGSFSERCRAIARGLGSREDATAAHLAARTWGATSGIDLLHGLVPVAEASLARRAGSLAVAG